MANNNVINVKFLRNAALYESREAAITALETYKVLGLDGTTLLARYSGTSETDVKTIAGYVWSDGTNTTITIVENKDDIDAKLGTGVTINNTATAQFESLSGGTNDTSASTSVKGAKMYASAYTESKIDSLEYTGVTTGNGVYVTNVTEADGVVSATTATLPSVNAISENGKAITAISETIGEISASAGTINAEYVNIKDSGNKFSASTVEDALAELADKATADKIASDDKTIIVTTASSGTDVSVNIDGTTLIKNGSTGVISSDLKIVSIEQGTGSSYASQYQLVYGNSNTPIGDVISVGKDQFLKEASYDASTQELTLVMYNSTGGTTDIVVDFSDAIIESEAGEGLYVSAGHTLNVGIANDSEAVTTGEGSTQAVLVVGEDSIKVQGIQAAIDYKVSTLDATVGSTTVATGKHVAVQVSESDGVLTAVTVTEDDIASAQGLANEITDRTNADTELSNRLGTGVTTANTATAQFAALSGNNQSTSAETSVEGAKRYADEILSTAVSGLDASVSAETTHITVKVDEVDGKLTAVTLTEKDIASASALTAEIAARKAVDGQDGSAYTKNTSANYISGATSLNDADVKLDAALKAEETRAIAAEKEAKTEVAYDNTAADSANGMVITKTDDGTDNHDIYTIQFGTLDCGTY